MNHLNKLFLVATSFLLLIVFTSTSFAQTPVTPDNGLTGVSQGTTTLSFSPFDDGVPNGGLNTYDVQLATTAAFGPSVVVTITGTTLTDFDISSYPLSYNTTYYWHVRDGDGTAAFHEYTFTTELSTPANTTPSGSSVYTDPVTFNWTADGDISNVEFYVTAGTDPGVTLNTVTSVTTGLGVTTVDLTLPNAGTYYWKVTATVNDGGAPNNGETKTSTATSFTQTLTAPSLSSPADLASGQDLNVDLSWTSAPGADEYTLEVNTDNGFGAGTAIAVSGQPQAGTNKAPGGLSDNTTYYWRVTASNSVTGETSVASGSRSFTTAQQSDGTAPVDASYSNSITPTFSWPAGPTGTDKYRLEVNTNGTFTGDVKLDTTTSATSKTLDGLALDYNTTYYWRVTAQSNLAKVNSSNVLSFTTKLAPANLTSPADLATGVSITPTLTFDAVSGTGTVTYTVQLSPEASFATPALFELYNINTSLSHTVPAGRLEWNTVYYWRVMATDANGNTSDWVKFSFTALNPTITLTDPVNGLTGVSIEPNFTWGDIDGEVSYELRISTTGTDTTSFNAAVVLEKTGLAANSVTYQLLETDITAPPFANNTKFYWMISARDAGGNKVNSVIYHYTTYPDLNPTLLWPSDGLTISGDDITFSWYINTGVGSLKFYVQYIQQSTTPTTTEWASGSTVNLPSTSDLFKAIGSNLIGGLKYYWRVIVKDGSDIVDYSSVNSFTTNGGTSVTLTPSWPVGGVTVYSNNPTLNWYPSLYVPGLKYRVRYSTSSTLTNAGGGTNDSLATGTSLDYTTDLFTDFPSDLDPGTIYYWQVRIYDPSSLESGTWSSVESFETNGSGTLVVPTPSFPLGSVTVYTAQPTFSWYTGTTGLGLVYDVEVQESGTPFTGTPTYEDVNALFKLSDPLTPGLSYHWQVRSDNGTTESGWSTEAEFSVSGGITTALPVAIWPVDNVSILSTTPTLSWTVPGSVLGITGYTVKYNKNSAPTWSSFSPGVPDVTDGEIAVSGGTTLFTELTTALDYGGHYYWAVASVDATGESDYSQGEFTITGGTGSGQPTLLAPEDASVVYNKKPTFSWYVPGSSNGITGYELVYSTSDVFAAPVTTTVSTTNTEYTPASDLTPGATYFWKVRSTYASLPASAFSSTFYFTVNPGAAPIQPVVAGPSDNLVVPTSEPTLAWKIGAVPNPTMTYELEIADNENMNNSNIISDIKTTYQKVTGLNNNQEYYWRVRSKNADGTYSDYSGKGKFYAKFSVTGVDDVNIVPKDYEVAQNYPNPFNPTTTIRFALPEASFVTLKIYNMLGQEVKTLVNEQKSAGTFNVQWKGDNDFGQKVSSGTYIYRVIAGANIFTKKMILLK